VVVFVVEAAEAAAAAAETVAAAAATTAGAVLLLVVSAEGAGIAWAGAVKSRVGNRIHQLFVGSINVLNSQKFAYFVWCMIKNGKC
jgi:hypothetical protein